MQLRHSEAAPFGTHSRPKDGVATLAYGPLPACTFGLPIGRIFPVLFGKN